MTDRGKRYLELVDEVKQDYKDKLRKNSNITLKGCDYCREINLWTYWQGLGYAERTPEIDILLVGQDWGNPNNPSQTVENIKTINMEIEDGENPIQYLQDADMERRDAQTDYNLIQIFKEVKGYDIENTRYSNLFFTNFSLGYRTGSGTGGMTKGVMSEDKEYFVKLCNILQPKKIICLGRITYEAVMSAFNKKPVDADTYNDMIKSYKATNVDCEGKTAQIYAVAHCGFYGTKNRGDIPKTKKRKEDLSNQIRDWNSILA